MPQVISGGPLDGGAFEFDAVPARVAIDMPARCGGPGVAVYQNDGRGGFRFTGWESEGDDVGQGISD